MKNTYNLNELLHKKDIDERLRSQFVGTTLLYIKDMVNAIGSLIGSTEIDNALKEKLDEAWGLKSAEEIRAGIKNTLDNLLDNSDNKTKKI